jgi:hypothetical protein
MARHAKVLYGDQTSVANRLASNNAFIRPEWLQDVACVNTTGGTLYMQVFDINDGMIPFGTAYAAGTYTLTGLVIGHTYTYNLGANETSLTNGAQVFNAPNAGTFVATATTAVFAGSGTNLVTSYIQDLTSKVATPAPVAGAIPRFSFPVLAGLGGTLGQEADMSGIFCAWSSTQATYTAAGASGSIVITVYE